MKKYIINLFIISILILFSSSIFADSDDFKIRYIVNKYDIQKPEFKWDSIEKAVVYHLFVNDKSIFTGRENKFLANRSFEFGTYNIFVEATKDDGTKLKSDTIQVTIGIQKPELETPSNNTKTYNRMPTFKWKTSSEADTCLFYLNGKKIKSISLSNNDQKDIIKK